MENVGIFLLVQMLVMSITAWMARKRQMNPFLWGALAFAFGVYALFGMMLIVRWRKRRQKPVQGLVVPQQEDPETSHAWEAHWFYANQKRQPVGPMSWLALKEARLHGQLLPDSLVWHPELSSWTPLSELPNFER